MLEADRRSKFDQIDLAKCFLMFQKDWAAEFAAIEADQTVIEVAIVAKTNQKCLAVKIVLLNQTDSVVIQLPFQMGLKELQQGNRLNSGVALKRQLDQRRCLIIQEEPRKLTKCLEIKLIEVPLQEDSRNLARNFLVITRYLQI
jgi:hypothetical protein